MTYNYPTAKSNIEAGDKIKTEDKAMVVYQMTSTTYFSKDGEYIHAEKNPKIVNKAQPIKEKNTIHDLNKGDLIQIKNQREISYLHRVYNIYSNKEKRWTILLQPNGEGIIPYICEDLVKRGINEQKIGQITPIHPHEKQTLHDWAGD